MEHGKKISAALLKLFIRQRTKILFNYFIDKRWSEVLNNNNFIYLFLSKGVWSTAVHTADTSKSLSLQCIILNVYKPNKLIKLLIKKYNKNMTTSYIN